MNIYDIYIYIYEFVSLIAMPSNNGWCDERKEQEVSDVVEESIGNEIEDERPSRQRDTQDARFEVRWVHALFRHRVCPMTRTYIPI